MFVINSTTFWKSKFRFMYCTLDLALDCFQTFRFFLRIQKVLIRYLIYWIKRVIFVELSCQTPALHIYISNYTWIVHSIKYSSQSLVLSASYYFVYNYTEVFCFVCVFDYQRWYNYQLFQCFHHLLQFMDDKDVDHLWSLLTPF